MTRPDERLPGPRVLWSPSPSQHPRIAAFMEYVNLRFGTDLDDYAGLWSWSVGHFEEFWAAVWTYYNVEASRPYDRVLAGTGIPDARWFDDSRLNFARHALRHDGPGPALIEETESRPPRLVSWAELRRQVASAAAGLGRLGVVGGDRVAGYLPNCTEAVVAFLACASIGAIWSCCSAEFGADAALSRFRQIEPKVLIVADGYRYAGKAIDRADEVAALRRGLDSVRFTVSVPVLDGDPAPDGSMGGALGWSDLMASSGPGSFADVPFAHPLYILYSSGTTGMPKAIMHGHGGILVEHFKMLDLHLDLRAGDRFFWFTTTGWMMWNYLVSGLLVGATVVLFDGDPIGRDPYRLWELAERLAITHFGVSATYLMNCRRLGIVPGERHDLRHLRHVGSTGSPLPAEGAEWVYEAVGQSFVLGSASGGQRRLLGLRGVVAHHAGVRGRDLLPLPRR